MAESQETSAYVTYSEYKNYADVELMWPIEISEDQGLFIIEFVKKNMKLIEINSSVKNK
jgi:hypothetical protein